MDELKKAKLRNTARITHWVSQLILVGVLIVLIAAALLDSRRQHYAKWVPLVQSAGKLTDAVSQSTERKIDSLMAFAPPADSARRIDWARNVREMMQFPVGVFIKEDSAIHWFSVPSRFLAATAQVPDFFAGNVGDNNQMRSDTLGNFICWKGSIWSEPMLVLLAAYAPLAGGTGWGILLSYNDEWSFTFEKMKPCSLVILDRSIEELAKTFQIRREKFTYHTGFCVWRNDSLIYATPGVDTTHTRHDMDVAGLHISFFASDQAEQRAEASRRLWRYGIILVIAVMIVLNRFWHWIKKLSTPLTNL